MWILLILLSNSNLWTFHPRLSWSFRVHRRAWHLSALFKRCRDWTRVYPAQSGNSCSLIQSNLLSAHTRNSVRPVWWSLGEPTVGSQFCHADAVTTLLLQNDVSPDHHEPVQNEEKMASIMRCPNDRSQWCDDSVKCCLLFCQKAERNWHSLVRFRLDDYSLHLSSRCSNH